MFEIYRNKAGLWVVDTEAFIDEGAYNPCGLYETKQAAIEAATRHGDSYIIIDG